SQPGLTAGAGSISTPFSSQGSRPPPPRRIRVRIAHRNRGDMEVMRDIGSRIGRYRLSRYASPTDPLRRHLRWFWLAAVVWIVWAGLLSKGSFYRLWRLDAERQRIERELEQTRGDIAALEKANKDPRLKRE